MKKIIVFLIVAAIALAGLMYLYYQHDMRIAQEKLLAGGSKVIDTACGPIEYAAMGEGQPVLVVHGAGGGFDQGLWIARNLLGNGFRIIAPSRFGYLRTPVPANSTPAAQADAYACLLDALKIQRVAIVGVSAGSPSTVQYALLHPDRTSAMVLLVPLAYAPTAQTTVKSPASKFMINVVLKSDFIVWLMSNINRSSILHLLGVPLAIQARMSPAEQVRLAKIIFPISQRQAGLVNEEITGRDVQKPYPLEQIRVPTLTISTADDPYNTFGGAKYTAEKIPGAKFIGLESGGHLFIGQEEKVRSEVVGFLRQHP